MKHRGAYTSFWRAVSDGAVIADDSLVPVGFTIRAPPSRDYSPQCNLQTIARLWARHESEGHLPLIGHRCPEWEFFNHKRAVFPI